MSRYQIAENTNILGKFNTGDTVTISLYDLSDGSSEFLDSSSCSEIGSTGIFKWNTSNVTTTPASRTEYLWIMDNSTYKQYGKIVLGGFVDDVDTTVSSRAPASEYDSQLDQSLSTTESNLITEIDTNETKIDALNNPTTASIADAVLQESVDDHKGTADSLAEHIDEIQIDTDKMLQVEKGRWKLDTSTNQLIFYEDDGVTELYKFDLYDQDGNSSFRNIFERKPI